MKRLTVIDLGNVERLGTLGKIRGENMKNYGYTISFNQRKLKKRVRGGSVFRTKKEADNYIKELQKTSKGFGISNVRSVKATSKEYSKSLNRIKNDMINSKPRRK